MADDAGPGDVPEAARLLHELALEYAARSHAAAADLIGAFEAAASALSAEIGDLVVTDDDDERLVLTARGRFSGRVLMDEPNPRWQPLDSPDDVAEHYDTVDLFADVADTVAEAFPAIGGSEPPEEPEEPAEAVEDETEPAEESATLRSLEHLHAAGVLSDAEFEAKKIELQR